MDSREAPLFLVLQGQLTVCYCPLQPWGRHSANPYGFGAAGIAARFWACRELLRTSRSNRARRMLTTRAWQEREIEREGGNSPLLISTYPMSFRGAYCLSNGCASRIPVGTSSVAWARLFLSRVNLTHRSHRSRITRFIIRTVSAHAY